ncbi:DUF6382 domain-containing protein [Salinicoccus halodurans]|uniref:FHA domain-containing protein n=1 Tax=Salinicoccus halodurans TaxID=407035 RepID=A0A0F7HJK6_9STAP|nr:DUF6382 domain-containing protein [Salinicoccus halodurans]AKG73261.1 hypothetical protein AAT16_02935 [Salinicoccus halodurans]SFK83182.1 FHA domain-containing protein [Salinicoccus halodurans]
MNISGYNIEVKDNKKQKSLESDKNGNRLTIDDLKESEYKMFLYNRIDGTLPINFVKENNHQTLHFNTENHASLSDRLEYGELRFEDFYRLIVEICNTLKKSRNNLLSIEKYCISEETIFVGERYYDIKLMYMPLRNFEKDESTEDELKRLVFNVSKKIVDIDREDYINLCQYLKHPNFSIENIKNYLLDIKNSGVSIKGDMQYGDTDKYKIKKIKTMPPLNRKEKLYSSLIAIVLLAVIWSQMPLSSNILLGTAFLLSVGVAVLLHVYWKKWRPGAEPIVVEKKVKKKVRKSELEDSELENDHRSRVFDALKNMDYDTFIVTKAVVQPEAEVAPSEESAYSAPEEASSKQDSTTGEDEASEEQETTDEVESFVLTDKTTLLEDEDDEELKRNVKLEKGRASDFLIPFDGKNDIGEAIAILGENFLIGRNKDESDYHVNDSNISRKHAMLVKKDDCYSFKDIGSVNGSKINDDKLIPYKLYELKSDDVITLGELSFKYRVNEA